MEWVESTDEFLLNRLKHGDHGAFEKIYRRHWRALYNAAYKRLKDEEQSEDVVQEVFFTFWEKREGLQIENLVAYLYAMVRNKIFKMSLQAGVSNDFLNSANKKDVGSESADAPFITREIFGVYEQIVAKLPPSQREIFHLKYHEALSTHEIAEQLKKSRKTIQNQLNHAVGKVKLALSSFLTFL